VVLPRSVVAAVVVIALQALGLTVLALILVIKALTGHPHSLAGALLDAVIALVGATVLGLCARALLGLRPAARTPVIVLEVLSLPVGYTLAFQASRPGYGAPILVAALAALYLLFTPSARAALDREL
jgi:hypothetical protein